MPHDALQRLRDGNRRFAHGRRGPDDDAAPFAVVLSCIDSRVPVEAVFDLPLGRVFSARVAGNVLNDDVLGSLEYACAVGGARAVVVLGHTGCGAVRAACEGARLGHLSGLLDKIRPVLDTPAPVGERTPGNAAWVDAVARAHVRRTCAAILAQSPLLRARVDDGAVGLDGAMYDVASRQVTFLGDA